MSEGEPVPASTEKRVGDSERRAVDDRLRAAHGDGMLTLVEYDERSRDCWAARTRSDLEVLVVDLPEPETTAAGGRPPETPPAAAPPASPPAPSSSPLPPAPPAPAAPAAPRTRRGGHGLFRRVVPVVVVVAAAFGAVQVAGADDGAAVFGHRVVQLPDTQDRAEVAVLFGSSEVVVPDGVRVRTSGTTIFGGVDCEQACAAVPGVPAPREIVVNAGGAFGSVDVVTRSEAARGGIDRRDRDD